MLKKFTPSKHHAMWIAIFSVFIGVLVLRVLALPPQIERLDSLPLKGATFDGEPLQLTRQESQYLGNAEAIKRLYTLGNDSFVVAVIDGTRNRDAVHNPDICYQGEGYTIIKESSLPIPGGEAKVLVMKKEGEVRELAYWYTTGTSRHSSPFKQHVQSTLRRLSLIGHRNEPFLVIIESASPGTDWNATLAAFPELSHI